jgi:hypothetical protein
VRGGDKIPVARLRTVGQVIKGEIDRPRMADLSRLAFRRPRYPALTPVNLGQTGEALIAVTLHKAHDFHGVDADQG